MSISLFPCTAVRSCRFYYLIMKFYFVWYFSKSDNMYHRLLPGRSLEWCRELVRDIKKYHDWNGIIQPY